MHNKDNMHTTVRSPQKKMYTHDVAHKFMSSSTWYGYLLVESYVNLIVIQITTAKQISADFMMNYAAVLIGDKCKDGIRFKCSK